MVPKSIALAGPDRAALWFGPPLWGICAVLRPVIVVFDWLANQLLRLVGVTPRAQVASTFDREQVASLVAESAREGLLEADEHELLTGALAFGQRPATSVLIPLAQSRTVPRYVTPREVEEAAAQTGFSRFPVHGRAADDLVGYLHLKDILDASAAQHTARVDPTWVRSLLRVGGADSLSTALRTMRASGSRLASVAARDRATLGAVALEDVVEELIAQIRDETRTVRQ